MKQSILLMGIWFLAISGLNPAVEPHNIHFNIVTLKPGIWAAIHNDETGHAIGNAGIVDLGNQTLVFDAFMNLDAAEELRKVATALTHQPIRYLINSHHHNDHIRGNQLFVDATVISTFANREAILRTEPEELRWEISNASKILQGYKSEYAVAGVAEKKEIRLWLNYFEGMVMNSHKIITRLPDQMFTDSLEIQGQQRRIKLHEFKGGHSISDVVMELPEDSIIFCGDLLFTDRHPYLADGNPSTLASILESQLKRGRQKFVPGHGNPCGADGVQQMIGYIHDLQAMVRKAKEANMSDSSILSLKVPEAYAGWPFRRFYQANLNHINKH